jgi:hypothetical protein
MRHADLFILTAITILCSISAEAAIYKGQAAYGHDCRSCHPSEQELVTSKTQGTWKGFMAGHGQMLAQVHLTSAEAEASRGYFSSSKFREESRHLKDFFIEYASDSGKILVGE